MAKRVIDDADLTVVADAIRGYTQKAGLLVFPDEVVSGVNDVFQAGKAAAEQENDAVFSYTNEKMTEVAPYGFYNSKLRRISLPALTNATGGSVFQKCENLLRVDLPAYANTSRGSLFDGDIHLQVVDFGNVTAISKKAFNRCYELSDVILRNQDMVTLSDVSAFDKVACATMYVPIELIDEYEGATNWSLLFEQGVVKFTELEGSVYG